MRKDWLHFYQMDFVEERSHYPKTIARGEGCYVIDSEGRSFFDSLSGAFCVNLGYGDMELVNAAYNSAREIHFTSPFSVANDEAIKLAHTISNSLVKVFKEESQVFFTNGGSEAIDTALKVALAVAKKRGENRKHFISMSYSYHGTTFGAASISGWERCRMQTGNLYKEVIFAPNSSSCHTCSCKTSDCNSINEFLQNLCINPNEVAAVIIEAVENQAGNFPASQRFIATVDKFCKEHGILIIVDEVITGFGRVGYQWAIEQHDIQPDIIVSAKGLTSGYESLGATAVRNSLEIHFRGDDDSYFMHGSTFGGRPSACAVASKVFELQDEKDIFSHVRITGNVIEQRLMEFHNQFSFIKTIAGKGFLWSIHFKEGLDGRQFFNEIIEKLCALDILPCLYQSRKAGFLEFAPPLIATEAQLHDVLDRYQTVLKTLHY